VPGRLRVRPYCRGRPREHRGQCHFPGGAIEHDSAFFPMARERQLIAQSRLHYEDHTKARLARHHTCVCPWLILAYACLGARHLGARLSTRIVFRCCFGSNARYRALIQWVRHRADSCRRVCSVCIGSFPTGFAIRRGSRVIRRQSYRRQSCAAPPSMLRPTRPGCRTWPFGSAPDNRNRSANARSGRCQDRAPSRCSLPVV
jgi:hypothetical protein